jgi:hypothetical protein
MPYKNPEDQKAYARRHYQENRELYLARSKKSNPVTRGRKLDYLHDYLRNHPCVDCGESDIVVLEFDHLPEFEKLFNATNISKSYDAIKAEIAKCEVVCANCHTRRTAKRGGWRKALLA